MKSLIFISCLLVTQSMCFSQQWPNPENQMLSDSISSFFYYSTNRPVAFSDPNSLRDTNYRGMVSDYYHDESEYILEQSRQSLMQQHGFYGNGSYGSPYGNNQFINYNQFIILNFD